ncbi:hypothetical protein AB0A98_06105 [Streptomyces chrestomyceticus]|uniref:hypothetical protein n=1 Tax=Streptomyces chrestomyceticus TaxID=68185 RepID=UPI003411C8A3
MTNPHTYGTQQWREAFCAAEDNAFCDIDSREKAGELAGDVCELRVDEADADEGLVFAAITVAGGLRGELDRNFLARVIKAYDEEKTTWRLSRSSTR